MKKMSKSLMTELDRFKGKKCIKVDIPIGTALYLHFGELVLLNGLKLHPIDKKIHLTSDFTLFFDWIWSIHTNNKIIASSRIFDNEVYQKSNEQIQIIKDKVLLDYEFNKITNELKLIFENGIIVRTFNDVVRAVEKNDVRKSSIFVLFTPNSVYSAFANGSIYYKEQSVQYLQTILEINPEIRNKMHNFYKVTKGIQNVPNEFIDDFVQGFREYADI